MEPAEHFTYTKYVTLSLLNNHCPAIDMPIYRTEDVINKREMMEKCSAVIRLPMAFRHVSFPSKVNDQSAVPNIKVVSGWSSIICNCSMHRAQGFGSDNEDELPNFQFMTSTGRTVLLQLIETENQTRSKKESAFIYGLSFAEWDRIMESHWLDSGAKLWHPCSWIIEQRIAEMIGHELLDVVFPQEEPPLQLEGAQRSHRIIPIWLIPLIVALYRNHPIMLPNHPSECAMDYSTHLVSLWLQSDALHREAIQNARDRLFAVNNLLYKLSQHDTYSLENEMVQCTKSLRILIDLMKDAPERFCSRSLMLTIEKNLKDTKSADPPTFRSRNFASAMSSLQQEMLKIHQDWFNDK
jgi:hypothetical protein